MTAIDDKENIGSILGGGLARDLLACRLYLVSFE